MKRFNEFLTVLPKGAPWLAIGLIGISAILAVIKPVSMPFLIFFLVVILPLIPLFGLVYWVLRSWKSWLAILVTVVYFGGLLYWLFLVFIVESITGCYSTSTNGVWGKHLFSRTEISSSEHCGSLTSPETGLTKVVPWNGVHTIRFRDGTRQMITYEDGKLVHIEVDYSRRTE